MLGPAVELAKVRPEVRTHVPHALLHPSRGESRAPDAGTWGRKPGRNGSVASVSITISGGMTEYRENMQLRYNYRLDPQPRHRAALGKAFASRMDESDLRELLQNRGNASVDPGESSN